jgi:hypothetical protein
LTVRAAGSKLKAETASPFCIVAMDDNHADTRANSFFTVEEIILQQSLFTAEQRSLAWSPEPPFQSTGAGDCRPGGNCGLDFNRESARARWMQARHRWNLEQRRLQRRPQAL